MKFSERGVGFSVTCSFGVSEWERGDTIDGLLRRADKALYDAKRSGRNCVVAADTSLSTTIDDRQSVFRSAMGQSSLDGHP